MAVPFIDVFFASDRQNDELTNKQTFVKTMYTGLEQFMLQASVKSPLGRSPSLPSELTFKQIQQPLKNNKHVMREKL